MIDLSDFTTLTFDCYGTLIDWEAGILAELRPWADKGGLALSDDALLEAFGAEESRAEAEQPSLAYPGILALVHQRLAVRWALGADAAAAAEFGASVARWPAFPDSPAALAYLKRHFKLVILSNVDRASFAHSNARLGVEFDAVFTAQDIGSYKPDPRNFDYALARLGERGIAPAQILHVAQSLFHDMVPARRCGLKTAWINRRHGRDGWGATPPPAGDAVPDLEFADMAELAARHRAAAGG